MRQGGKLSGFKTVCAAGCGLGIGFLALGGAALIAQPGGVRPAIPFSEAPVERKTVAPASKLEEVATSHTTPSPAIPANNLLSKATSIVQVSGKWSSFCDLVAGKTIEISVHLEKPSALPANGRLAVEWEFLGEAKVSQDADRAKNASSLNSAFPSSVPNSLEKTQVPPLSTLNASVPLFGFRKILHALDSDVYVVYRAPKSGKYALKLTPVIDELPIGDAAPRWREKGNAAQIASLPSHTPWKIGEVAPVFVSVKPVDFEARTKSASPKTSALASTSPESQPQESQTLVETEPNDSPEQAQPIALTAGRGDEVRTWDITGGADDVEFFDNGKVGESGEDWFRLDYKGAEPRLMTAQLGIPGQSIAARIRCYVANKATNAKPGATASTSLAGVSEFLDGQNPNERVHQQDEAHRSMISRLFKPGETYFLRVEANAPGYHLQLRTLKPGPYADPKMAVRQGMYQHIGQVDAWLTNRPRGISVERRIRDTGNLLGTQCMSCHTQSGVWGPSVPVANGYRIENVQNFWHMTNVMYECLRPTNVLKDAANNTSLAPLDIGDGPAGTRAAGYNIVNLERVTKPSKLHSKQQIRTANFVLQTGDPGGINAAGPGSNVGQVVVYVFSSEILKTAWEKTGDPKYFRALEEKARAVVEANIAYTDDIALRLSYFSKIFPIKSYVSESMKAADAEAALSLPAKSDPSAVEAFSTKVKALTAQDEARLRAIQNADGSWSFSPGSSPDGGKTWKSSDATPDPSPTALAVSAFWAIGAKKDDPTLTKGVKALLAMQEPSGRWNKAAQTGFVSTAYALHALSRLYPETPKPINRNDYLPKQNESLTQTLKRVQALALTAEPKFVDLMVLAAKHESPLVRYWAMIGLGATHANQGVLPLTAALSDRVKMVREAATWGLKQTLLDDKGWNETLAICDSGNDDARAQAMQALGIRADAVMPKSSVNWIRLTVVLDRAMNRDPNPAVRAWAVKAAWQWWIWNPPVRSAINASWLTLLSRPESNALAENSSRYATQALFIANGHKANGSSEHQYKELATLFEAITKKLDAPGDETVKLRLASRLIGVGGTFFQTSGGDGGPGQMGYVTPGSGEMMGKAATYYLDHAAKEWKSGKDDHQLALIRAGLEGGANVPYQPLTAFLVDYSLKGPEELRQLAASSVSDPRSVSLPAVPELVQPQFAQIMRGANEPPRRAQLSDPILELWSKVNWNIPKTDEQQRSFFDFVIPKLDNYRSPEEIAALTDPVKRIEAEKEMSAKWYLAEKLGEVLQTNPDLHQEIVLLHYFPVKPKNPLEEAFWLPNVEWMLTYNPKMMQKLLGTPASASAEKSALPGVAPNLKLAGFTAQTPPAKAEPTPAKPQLPDPIDTVKDRVLQLYLDQLKETANPKTRATAIRMANQTALRRNPEVLRALAEVLQYEKTLELRSIIQNALKQSSEKFLPDLISELKREKDASVRFDATGNPQLTKTQQEDVVYFRDYVMPELNRQKRTDQQACMGCHGLPGRVPSLYLKAPDKYGYTPVADLLVNYRTLQKRVAVNDIEKSKLLRKPLNIQDGKEDGHQGGRRYAPADAGYLIIRKWVESQPEVQKPASASGAASPPPTP